MNLIQLFLTALTAIFVLYLLAEFGTGYGIAIFAESFFSPLGFGIILGYAWITGIIIKL
ncbi:MAG: hypothetical protein Q7S92_05580 [Candidatus Diapherotrites archaeon]|nr:hypothetical protein [Candidatus Diapherotrites archaeon]